MSDYIEKPDVPRTKSKPTFARMAAPASMGYRRAVKVVKITDLNKGDNNATENL